MAKATSLNMGKVIQVNIPDVGTDGVSPSNYFTSKHSSGHLPGGVEKYSAAQFHFHVKSEHTINGRRYDMEMHTVHLAQKSRRLLADDAASSDGGKAPFASAVGIIFDRYNYDPTVTAEERLVIDKFFDAINFGSSSTTTNADGYTELAKDVDIPYGQLTKTVNFASRWAYQGSLTTPPCTTSVYFQVVDRVLPISQKHYDAYVAQQAKHTSTAYFGAKDTDETATALTTPK